MILYGISAYSVVIWIVAAITASFGLVVYIGGPNRSSRVFLATVISMASWTATVGAFIAAADAGTATLLVKLAYFCGILVSASFFYFFLVYPDNKKPKAYVLPCLWLLIILIGYVILCTDAIIAQAHPVGYFVRWGWSFGPYWPLFYLVFYALFISGVVLVVRTIPRLTEMRQRNNLKYMIVSVLVIITPPTFLNIILPQFQVFHWIWLGPILSVGWIAVLAYSIVRFRQLDIRAFTTEILNISLIIIFFANIFNSFSGAVWGRTLTFFVFLVISYYIIRLGMHVDDLNRNLKSKVAEQTKEIQGLYEIEKKARQELERLNEAKDQFILITQHHLRTPLTRVKWALEALQGRTVMDDSYPTDIADALGSVQELNSLMDNFLHISELQAGKNILSLEKASVLPLIEGALRELKPDIEELGLHVEYPRTAALWPDVSMDVSRIKEAVFIIMQNAVKYNVAGGKISLRPSVENEMFSLDVANTGIGIEKSELESLFTGVFSRGTAASKANPLGMGMGLTFARYIFEAHKGTLSVRSDGPGKGAEVGISLPLS